MGDGWGENAYVPHRDKTMIVQEAMYESAPKRSPMEMDISF